MPKRAKRAKVNDEPIILVDNPMKAKHAKPPVDEHGLCLANPARVLVVGGCGASKTTTILNCIARGAMWKPWDGGIYLMAPTKDVQQGEYGLVDTEYLEQLDISAFDFTSVRPTPTPPTDDPPPVPDTVDDTEAPTTVPPPDDTDDAFVSP